MRLCNVAREVTLNFFRDQLEPLEGTVEKEKKKGQYFVGGWRVIVRMTQGTHELLEEALFLILCHALANRTLNIARAFWCGDLPYPRPSPPSLTSDPRRGVPSRQQLKGHRS